MSQNAIGSQLQGWRHYELWVGCISWPNCGNTQHAFTKHTLLLYHFVPGF